MERGLSNRRADDLATTFSLQKRKRIIMYLARWVEQLARGKYCGSKRQAHVQRSDMVAIDVGSPSDSIASPLVALARNKDVATQNVWEIVC